MSERKEYTILVKHQRVKIRKEVYHAYHKEGSNTNYLRT